MGALIVAGPSRLKFGRQVKMDSAVSPVGMGQNRRHHLMVIALRLQLHFVLGFHQRIYRCLQLVKFVVGRRLLSVIFVVGRGSQAVNFAVGRRLLSDYGRLQSVNSFVDRRPQSGHFRFEAADFASELAEFPLDVPHPGPEGSNGPQQEKQDGPVDNRRRQFNEFHNLRSRIAADVRCDGLILPDDARLCRAVSSDSSRPSSPQKTTRLSASRSGAQRSGAAGVAPTARAEPPRYVP